MNGFIDRKGKWIFLSLVNGVDFSDDSSREVSINGITFIRGDKMSRVRKRLGFSHPISYLAGKGFNFFENLEKKVFAIKITGGQGRSSQAKFEAEVSDALHILSLSQLLLGQRWKNGKPRLTTMRSGSIELFSINCSADEMGSTVSRVGHLWDVKIDHHLQLVNKTIFFDDLLKMLDRESKVPDGWKRSLLNAAVLVGESQGVKDQSHAFTLNCIAIEALLLEGKGKHKEMLEKRMSALFEWADKFVGYSISTRMLNAYDKRCNFVHDGEKSNITLDDVLFTDLVVANLFYLLVNNFDIFKCKDDLRIFSEQYEAKKVLSYSSIVEPKKFQFISFTGSGVYLQK